jgi:hypothetical protein
LLDSTESKNCAVASRPGRRFPVEHVRSPSDFRFDTRRGTKEKARTGRPALHKGMEQLLEIQPHRHLAGTRSAEV